MKHTLVLLTAVLLAPLAALHAFDLALVATDTPSGLPAVASGDLLLVQDGQPKAEIVVAETRPRMTTLAAVELRHFIEKMSGARLPVVTTPSAARVKIYVGESAATKRLGGAREGLRDGAYRLLSGPDWLALVGPDKDFDFAKMPWPLKRNDVPRAEAAWKKMTAGHSDAEWRFPFRSGFKAFWNPSDFVK